VELVIGLVGAVGSDLTSVCEFLRDELADVQFESHTVRLSRLLHDIPRWKDLQSVTQEEERIRQHMDAGDELRQVLERNDAMALLAVAAIKDLRADTEPRRTAYILDSLKHPAEVETLRDVYGRQFILVSVYSPRDARLDRLAQLIADSHNEPSGAQYRPQAEALALRDEADLKNDFGQDVRDTFPKGDIFVDAGNREKLRSALVRFIELFFGNPFHTPTREEYGMFVAHAAARRSASLSRQVGAAIATTSGDIIAVGTNEVPFIDGGLCWPGDEPDSRDFVLGYETNDRMKRHMLVDLLERLRTAGWVNKTDQEIKTLVGEAVAGSRESPLRGSRLMNLIEFNRAVHAEMAALVDAARRGVAVQGATLYTTTFPCHDCAKHIVASGIRRAVYVEPYAKSLAADLYPDAVAVDAAPANSRPVRFDPFVGMSPMQYMEVFAARKRKTADGSKITWTKAGSKPRFADQGFQLHKETRLADSLRELLHTKELRPRQ
jgi:deoxycytidylate deaminase